ncbi:MAG: hypothetical protein ABEH64_10725 [Salinirussus sp.]
MDLTLLEVHLDGATLTANAPFAGEESEAGQDVADDEDRGLLALLPFVLVIGVLAGLAYIVRRWRSGRDTATIEPTVSEPDVATA